MTAFPHLHHHVQELSSGSVTSSCPGSAAPDASSLLAHPPDPGRTPPPRLCSTRAASDVRRRYTPPPCRRKRPPVTPSSKKVDSCPRSSWARQFSASRDGFCSAAATVRSPPRPRSRASAPRRARLPSPEDLARARPIRCAPSTATAPPGRPPAPSWPPSRSPSPGPRRRNSSAPSVIYGAPRTVACASSEAWSDTTRPACVRWRTPRTPSTPRTSGTAEGEHAKEPRARDAADRGA